MIFAYHSQPIPPLVYPLVLLEGLTAVQQSKQDVLSCWGCWEIRCNSHPQINIWSIPAIFAQLEHFCRKSFSKACLNFSENVANIKLYDRPMRKYSPTASTSQEKNNANLPASTPQQLLQPQSHQKWSSTLFLLHSSILQRWGGRQSHSSGCKIDLQKHGTLIKN